MKIELKGDYIITPRREDEFLNDKTYTLLTYLINVGVSEHPFTTFNEIFNNLFFLPSEDFLYYVDKLSVPDSITSELYESVDIALRSIEDLRDLGILTTSETGLDTVWTVDFTPLLNWVVSKNKQETKKKKKTKKTKGKTDFFESILEDNSIKLLLSRADKKHHQPTERVKTIAENYAEENKAKETATEKKIRELLENDEIEHTTQKPIYTSDGFYIVDFYLPEANLVVEVDGGYHYTSEQIEYDNIRNDKLLSLGYNVLRFSNKDYRKGWRTIREIIKNDNIIII